MKAGWREHSEARASAAEVYGARDVSARWAVSEPCPRCGVDLGVPGVAVAWCSPSSYALGGTWWGDLCASCDGRLVDQRRREVEADGEARMGEMRAQVEEGGTPLLKLAQSVNGGRKDAALRRLRADRDG